MRDRRRGSAIAVILMVIALALTVTFSLANATVFHLNVIQSTVAHTTALDLAESAIAQAAAQVLEEADGNLPVSPTLTVDQAGPGTLSYLTFVANNSHNLPWSVNNLAGTGPLNGALPETPVPAASVQFVGIGVCGAVQVKVEGVLHFPPFPWVVACTGTFQSPQGGVSITQLAGLPPPGMASLPPCMLLPGGLASNSSANPAILLGPNSIVTGDVQAPGSIVLSPSAKVLGLSQPGSASVTLPQLCTSHDPTAGLGGVGAVSAAPSCGASPVVLQGPQRAPQSVTISGDLDLQGAVLFVQGNLSIGGALRGTGLVWTTGQISVAGGATLTATNVMALVAGGDIIMTGPPDRSSTFYGVIYTHGNLDAENFQLYGNFVAQSPGSSGNITMNNDTVGALDTGTAVTVTTTTSTTTTTTAGSPVICTTGPTNPATSTTQPGYWTVVCVSNSKLCHGKWVAIPANQRRLEVCCTIVCHVGGTSTSRTPTCSTTTTVTTGSTSTTTPPPASCTSCSNNTSFTFDLNQFISLADQARWLLWRQL